MIVRRMHYELVDIIARVRREKAWRPTPAQEQTASRLADSDGGWVRTRGDGATELRTIERGESRRYVIHKDGKAELIESGLAPPRFVWSGHLQAAGLLWFLGAVGLLGRGEK